MEHTIEAIIDDKEEKIIMLNIEITKINDKITGLVEKRQEFWDLLLEEQREVKRLKKQLISSARKTA